MQKNLIIQTLMTQLKIFNQRRFNKSKKIIILRESSHKSTP